MIHQYQNNGYNIVLDVNSGAVHVVDQEAYDVIEVLNRMNEDHTVETLKSPETAEALKKELGEKYSEKDLLDILEAVTELTEQGRLFTKDIYESFIDVVKQRKTVVKALCLHIAHDCNLACKYCFAEEGEYHGRRALMSYEVGKKALDFLIHNMYSSTVHVEDDIISIVLVLMRSEEHTSELLTCNPVSTALRKRENTTAAEL